jgi:hypothetical protein
MPLTSYHFGPGLLLKSVLPRRFSFAAFAATEVAVDVETLVNLIRHHWPVHDRLHSLPGSLAVGLATHLVGRTIVTRLPRRAEEPLLASEVSLGGALLGESLPGIDQCERAPFRLPALDGDRGRPPPVAGEGAVRG